MQYEDKLSVITVCVYVFHFEKNLLHVYITTPGSTKPFGHLTSYMVFFYISSDQSYFCQWELIFGDIFVTSHPIKLKHALIIWKVLNDLWGEISFEFPIYPHCKNRPLSATLWHSRKLAIFTMGVYGETLYLLSNAIESITWWFLTIWRIKYWRKVVMFWLSWRINVFPLTGNFSQDTLG